jgi:hypothetical protein
MSHEEMRRYFEKIEQCYVPTEAVTQIKTPPFRADREAQARQALMRHGCIIEAASPDPSIGDVLITFPAGTTRREKLPRLPESTYYRILLPDGCELRETVFRQSPQLSYLSFPYEYFPEFAEDQSKGANERR